MEDPAAIVNQMRFENYERFKTLVRMHLSFELDLNTDEFDYQCHEVIYIEKGKMRKWNRLSKKIKGNCSSLSGKPVSSPMMDAAAVVFISNDLIQQLKELKNFMLRDENVKQEGIFRRTGSVSRQNELRAMITQLKPINLDNGFTVHDCATVYKGLLAELSEPLLTDSHYPAHSQIAELCNGSKSSAAQQSHEEHILYSVQLLLLLLPEENRALLEDIIEMLHTTAKYESYNKMNADTLATLFTPHLICPRQLPPEALHYVSQTMSSVISYMIVKGLKIFEIPPKLATDIRAYVHEQNRKKTMSPEQILDESISDISTVNTVYTFVDREKTAEAHNSNPTDTALAQLYAHIQSLPESSKKRKLIKQFNKENGQGTPLQLLMLDRAKNSNNQRSAKSFGDSIKKHIFHKGIMSRTPKRAQQNLSSYDTPNTQRSNHGIQHQKMRVLFHSPLNTPTSSHFRNTDTPKNASIKKHPLQKSISSTSLVKISPKVVIPEISSALSSSLSLMNRTVTSFESSQVKVKKSSPSFQTNFIKKNVAFLHDTSSNPASLVEVEDTSSNRTKFHNVFSDLSSRYKSEPNLSRAVSENKKSFGTPATGRRCSSFTNRLMKGVSLCSLRFPFPDVSKKPLRSANQLVKRYTSLESTIEVDIPTTDRKNSIISCRSADVTPKMSTGINQSLSDDSSSSIIARKSMSPITKSTQRMPKFMQESIMTPRSRKPVMLATLGSQDGNQTSTISFREEDEESLLSTNDDEQSNTSVVLCRSFSENDLRIVELQSEECERVMQENGNERCKRGTSEPNSLTDTFRDYLLKRSLLTTAGDESDSSNSCRSDCLDMEMVDLETKDLSESLLYCLDGNRPSIENSLSSTNDIQNSQKSNKELKRSANFGTSPNYERVSKFCKVDKNLENFEISMPSVEETTL